MAPTLGGVALLLLLVVVASAALIGHSLGNSVPNGDGTMTHHLHFKVRYKNVTRLCNTKRLVSVNGQFPGPTIYVRQDDRLLVRVSNKVDYNISIHWHGARQMYSVWADGPAYITQCPLQPGAHYTHNFSVSRETGTLFWHAHISWLRATLYGAFIILPKTGVPYPFPVQPVEEFPILLGEWWNMDVEEVEKYALVDGAGYNLSNAITINGQPGFLYNCSQQDTTAWEVSKGQSYLLRVVNAAMNFHMYFAVAKHRLTVVETDCLFAKPYTTEVIVLAPGQTADVLLTADQEVGEYAAGAAVYSPAREDRVPYPNITATAILRYKGAASTNSFQDLPLPSFPATNDSAYALSYVGSLRSLNSAEHPALVPRTVDRSFLFTAGYSVVECPAGVVCHGPPAVPDGPQGLVGGNVNNVSFVPPPISILQAYYELAHVNDSQLPNKLSTSESLSASEDAYEEDFPSMPLFQYNYTGENPTNKHSDFGTKVVELDLGVNVQVVLQNTATLFFESHPFHLHGHNFYVVGMGLGNYNSSTDPDSFNLVDPPAMNTVSVPAGGWVAFRFFTDNPGVWLMHCHIEMHTTWGMQMVWIVKEGSAPNQKLPPPPKDYPKC